MIDKFSEYSKILAIILITAIWILFIYSLRDNLPVLLIGIILIISIIWIKENLPPNSLLIIITIIIIIWWLLVEVSSLIAPFIISFVFAYLLEPLIKRLQKWMSRGTAIVLISFLTLAILITSAILILPTVINQIGEIIDKIPTYFALLSKWYKTVLTPLLAKFGIYINPQRIEKQITNELFLKSESIIKNITIGLIGLSNGVTFVIEQIISIVLIPFLTYYFLRDYKNIKKYIYELFPVKHRDEVTVFINKVNVILTGYIRGQLLVSVIIGFLTSIALMIAGIDYYLIFGILAGVMNLIPRIGLIFTLLPISIVALLQPSPFVTFIKALVAFFSVHLVETVFSPKIVGDKVGLHPILAMFSIFFFAHFWGFVGLLIAIPAMSILKLIIDYLIDIYKKLDYYNASKN